MTYGSGWRKERNGVILIAKYKSEKEAKSWQMCTLSKYYPSNSEKHIFR